MTKTTERIESAPRAVGMCRLAEKTVLSVLITLCFALPSTSVLAQSAPHPSVRAADAYHTPKPGSAERKAIMDALHAPVEKELGVKVIFVVSNPEFLRVVRDWAFVDANFRHPNGKRLEDKYLNPVQSDEVQALLHRVHGKWQVVIDVTGVTDVEWEEWPAKYHAPADVVPH